MHQPTFQLALRSDSIPGSQSFSRAAPTLQGASQPASDGVGACVSPSRVPCGPSVEQARGDRHPRHAGCGQIWGRGRSVFRAAEGVKGTFHGRAGACMRWLRGRACRRGRLLQAGKGPRAALLPGLCRGEPLGGQVGGVRGGGRCLKGPTPADPPGSQQAHPTSASTASPPAQGASYLHTVLAPEPSPSSRPHLPSQGPSPAPPLGTGRQERTPSPSSRRSGSFLSGLRSRPRPAACRPPPPPTRSPPPGQPGRRQALGQAQAVPPR